MKLSDHIKEILAVGAFASLIIGAYTFVASAEDLDKLEKKVQDREAIQKIKDINQDIELAKAKEKAGFEGQEDLIRLLEQQKKEVLLEQGVKD